jgi:hypothetical protein
MQSKNKKAPTSSERRHIEAVKSLACSVCDAPPPSECHEPEQGLWFASAALCADCHRGSFNGWHGQRRAWSLRKLSEIDAIAKTVERLMS